MLINPKFILSLPFTLNILIIVYIFVKASLYCNFSYDDYGYSVYNEGEKFYDCLRFNFEHGSGYIGMFLSKFVCVGIPGITGIHPNDFIGGEYCPGGFIKGFFAVLVLYIACLSGIIHFKSDYIKTALLFFVTTYFIYVSKDTGIYCCYYNYFRYFFSLAFIYYLLNFLYKKLINGKRKVNIAELSAACFCAFEACCSIETSNIMLILIFIGTICINPLISIVARISKKNLNFAKQNLGIKFFLPVVFGVTSFLLFISSPGFKSISESRHLYSTVFSSNLIKEFISCYYNECFVKISFYWYCFLVISVISIFFAIKRKKEIKKLIFPYTVQIAILLSFFSLVLCGKSYGAEDGILQFFADHPEIEAIEPNGEFFLNHGNLIFIYKMLILIPLLFLFSFCINNTVKYLKAKKIKTKNFLTAIIILIVTLTFILIGTIRHENISPFACSEEYRNLKIRQYMTEKMLRFYYLKNEIPQIPIKALKENNPHNIANVSEKTQYGDFCYNDSIVTRVHFPSVYKEYKAREQGYCFSADAFEQFEKEGGSFDEKELSELKFSKLCDENFVLKQAENPVNAAERY